MLMRAAQTLVAAGLPGKHGLLPSAKANSATLRALRLLETHLGGERAANELELSLLYHFVIVDKSTASAADNLRMTARFEELQKRADAEKKAEPQRQGPLTVAEIKAAFYSWVATVFNTACATLKVRGNGTPRTPSARPVPPTLRASPAHTFKAPALGHR